MKKNKITKTEFIQRFKEINEEYKLLVKDIKNIVKKSDKLLVEGEDLYIDSKDGSPKPSFKSLSKMMNKLEEIDSLICYICKGIK